MVWLPLTVGFCEILQQTPRAVTDDPPVLVTLPPHEAVVAVILLTVLVVTIGIVTVVNVFCSPYTVPSLLVAYART